MTELAQAFFSFGLGEQWYNPLLWLILTGKLVLSVIYIGIGTSIFVVVKERFFPDFSTLKLPVLLIGILLFVEGVASLIKTFLLFFPLYLAFTSWVMLSTSVSVFVAILLVVHRKEITETVLEKSSRHVDRTISYVIWTLLTVFVFLYIYFLTTGFFL